MNVSYNSDRVQIINEDISIHMNEEVGNGQFGKVFKGTYKNGPCAKKGYMIILCRTQKLLLHMHSGCTHQTTQTLLHVKVQIISSTI